MFKLSPEVAAIFGAFGEGVLLVVPWLLDQNTMDLLSNAGYDPNEAGKIYTGIRMALATVLCTLIMSLTVGILHPLVSILLFAGCALGIWMLPNYFLSQMHKR